MRSTRILLLVVALAALLAAPAVLTPSLVNATIQMLIAVLFAMAFNLLSGQGGMLSFGHAAYFGIGAFATVHAMNAAGGNGLLPTPLLPLVGGAAGLVTGIIAGWFATKRTGVYFAMITLALAELLHALAPHIKGWFGGEAGLSTMRMPAWGFTFGDSHQVYYLTLFWVLLSIALLYLYTLTPVGRLTLGLRENTNRLRFLGYNVHRLGVLVFAVSTMFSGVAGALQAINMEAANYVVFESGTSAAVVLNSYIGGTKVFLGPALGAALMAFFGYAVSDLTRSWLLYQGIIFVLVMLFVPGGLSGLINWWISGCKSYGMRRILPIAATFVIATFLVAGGTVFTVELLQRFFSQDYRSLAALNGSGSWPAIVLFNREWAPTSVLTWLPPLVSVVAGIWLARAGSRRWHRMKDEADAVDQTALQPAQATRSPV